MRTAGIENEREPFLDLARALGQAGPEPTAPAAGIRRRDLSLGLVLSLALHLLPLLLLIAGRITPAEAPRPIPVQLVVEQPPPPPPVARTEPVVKPPRGRLASEEVGEKAAEPTKSAAAPPSAAQPQTDPDRQAAPESDTQPRPQPQPELRQAANLIRPQQEPTLLDRKALALPAPDIEPLPRQPVAPASPRQAAPVPTPRQPTQHAAAIVGPPAARDEYLASLVALVRPYLRLLSPDIVNGRRGTTSLAIRVLGDGTIARIAVLQSSGYPDIDARIMQIVAAVGRFPPLPPWIDQPSWDINFHLRFPLPADAARGP